jgi:hypothetical protein
MAGQRHIWEDKGIYGRTKAYMGDKGIYGRTKAYMGDKGIYGRTKAYMGGQRHIWEDNIKIEIV